MSEHLIYGKMVKAVQLFHQKGISKDDKNKFQGFNYRSIDSTLSAASEIFSEVGIFVTTSVIERTWGRSVVETAKGARVDYTLQMDVLFKFIAEDGSEVGSTVTVANTAQDDSKLLGQCLSYAFKECLFKTFIIPTVGTEDVDAMDANRNQGVKAIKKTEPEPTETALW